MLIPLIISPVFFFFFFLLFFTQDNSSFCSRGEKRDSHYTPILADCFTYLRQSRFIRPPRTISQIFRRDDSLWCK
ncbi:hypothetical protein GGR50DRAFT_307052 [Xylaria sp. CBS 124048]|nr:hypothetical protein GGR50DRAFT_307052 [Xylaria sp. CBS 124048]